MSQSGARDEINTRISEKIGFPFKEEELSPILRKSIGESAQHQYDLYKLRYQKGHYEQGASTLSHYVAAFMIFAFLVFLLSAGWLSLRLFEAFIVTITIGAVLVIVGFLVHERPYKAEKKRIAQIEIEISTLSSKLEEEISSLSNAIYKELSEAHEARVRPLVRHVTVNFAEIIQAAKGRGLILETIECPHCAAPVSLPRSGESFRCEHCGKTVNAVNVFEMLRDLLKQPE